MGSSKKVTVGYMYYLGLHFGLCQGPVDAVQRIIIGDRDAWTGSVTSSGSISINAPELFGGEKREGGVVGTLDILMGESTQIENSYLQGKIGALIPAFRGILSAVWRGGHVTSNNPYIKPWAFRVKRILQGWTGGSAWYPEKAEITGSPVLAFDATGWEYQQIAHHADPATTNLTIPSAGWTPGPGPFGTGVAAPGELVDPTRPPNSPWEIKTILWAKKQLILTTSNSYLLRVRVENGCVIFINGLPAYTINPSNTQIETIQTVDLPVSGPIVDIAIKAYDEVFPALGGTYLDAELMILDKSDMNPAHILYQCLTDTAWGIGYPTSTIDEDSFTAAADTLYSENFGLSMVWNQQETIENFIAIILDHIGGMIYVRPDTGDFALKLIRNDYDAESLPLFDPDTLISAEGYQRQAWGETVNEITVIYTDGASGNEASITVQDLANIQTQGGIVAQTVHYTGITNANLAQRVAVRDLFAAATPLAKIRLTATRAAWEVFPGSVIRVSWPEYGIDDVVYRVLQVNRGTLQDGQIIIDAVEDVFGLPENSYLVDQPGSWTDPRSDPAAAPYRKVIEAPYWDLARSLTAADLAYVDALAGYVETLAVRPSDDATNYVIATRVGAADYQEQGVGSFGASATIDGALTRTTTALALENGVDLDLVEPGTYAIIDNEYVLVSEIDADAGTATIARGVLDTLPQTHADGARIWFADGYQGFDSTEYADAETVDVKMLPATGMGTLDIALATADSLTMDQRQYRPYPPGKLRVNTEVYPETIPGTDELTVSWAHRDRLAQTAYIVTQDEASIGPEAATTYTLRIYGEEDTLIRTETGITGTSFTYPAGDEAADSGLPPIADEEPEPLGVEPGYPYNSIMLDFEGSNGSTTFRDWIGNSWTASGNAQLTTTTPLVGSSSLLLDGTGDLITAVCPGALGLVDFTVRCKIRVASLAADGEIISISDSTADLNKFNLVFEVKTTGALRGSIQKGASSGVNVDITTATSLIAINTTYDVAFVADGSTARLYIDGVQRASGTITGTRYNQQSYCRIGYLSALPTRYFNGRIDDLLVRAGECMHPGGTTFTPPASITTWNRLSYVSRFTTFGLNDAQGVASDGTNLYFSGSSTLAKYSKTGTLITSRSVTGDEPTTKNQINGLYYRAGRLFATAAKFVASAGTSWIVEYDPDDLTYVQHWNVTGDWFADGLAYHGGYWWVIFHATMKVAQLDEDFSIVAEHDLDFYISGASGGYGSGHGYAGIAWYGDHVFMNIHDIYNENYCDVYGWSGSAFVKVARLRWPTTLAYKGIALDPTEADTLWFAERATSGTDSIAKVSILGSGMWLNNNVRMNGHIRFELAAVRDGLESWQHHEHEFDRVGYGYNYGQYYGGI